MIELKDLKRQLGSLEKDDLLKLFGVEERRTPVDYLLPALGLFGAGIVVGAGLGLLFAPKPGLQLREDLRSRLSGAEVPLPGESARLESAPPRL
jgi:hypothetical protein